MKTVLATIILPVMLLSLSQLAAGQADSNSLDAELTEAAERGDTVAVQQLLQKGANIEAKEISGGTALMTAAADGQTEVVELLLERGAEINAKDNDGKTALDMAKSSDLPHSEVTKLLREKGAK